MFGSNFIKISIAKYPATMSTLCKLSQRYSIADHAHQEVRIDHVLFDGMGNPLLVDLNLLGWEAFLLLHGFGFVV